MLKSMASQMKRFAQRVCDTTKSLVVDKLEYQNRNADNLAVMTGESKALSSNLQEQFQQAALAFQWRSRRNEAQYKYNCSVLINLIEVGTTLEYDYLELTKDLVQTGMKAIIFRNKCIKLVDTSLAGWSLIHGYLSNGLANIDDDDDKISRTIISGT
jgi:hypothetical protein